jgi:hypothetical protein
VRWDKKAPFASTRRLYEEVLRAVAGRGGVFFPVRAYNYGGCGMPAYMEATGLSQAEVAAKLIRIAWECGGAGISLECVDHDNYKPETRKAMRTLLRGPYRYRKSVSIP